MDDKIFNQGSPRSDLQYFNYSYEPCPEIADFILFNKNAIGSRVRAKVKKSLPPIWYETMKSNKGLQRSEGYLSLVEEALRTGDWRPFLEDQSELARYYAFHNIPLAEMWKLGDCISEGFWEVILQSTTFEKKPAFPFLTTISIPVK